MVVAIVVEDFYGFSDRDQMSVIFAMLLKYICSSFVSLLVFFFKT